MLQQLLNCKQFKLFETLDFLEFFHDKKVWNSSFLFSSLYCYYWNITGILMQFLQGCLTKFIEEVNLKHYLFINLPHLKTRRPSMSFGKLWRLNSLSSTLYVVCWRGNSDPLPLALNLICEWTHSLLWCPNKDFRR